MQSAADAIPAALAHQTQSVGMRFEDETLIVGVSSALSEEDQQASAQKIKKELKLEVVMQVVDADIIEELLSSLYREFAENPMPTTQVIATTGDAEGPIAAMVQGLLERSVRMRASDIHVEPTDKDLVVRLRIDGQLEELMRLPENVAPAIVSRLKVLAKMNIVERRRPQDGQFGFTVDGRAVDVRLATVSTIYGEKAVMRLLDTRRALTDLKGLGMTGERYEKFLKMVHSQHGLVIAAGPTGSGKTTTLHSALHEIDVQNLNVSTIEDPVEYVMKGINHLPVVEDIGVGFAVQLRALLRQDPDVILVGETRDSETARISVQAALSGRLVLTSLHATDSLSVIFRLMQMDIEPYLVAASLRGVVSQRLLRRVCDYCAYEYNAHADEKLLLKPYTHATSIKLRRGKGCTVCRGTGYRDRVGVYQILDITERIREVISTRPDPVKLEQIAAEEGLKSLAHEAFQVALSGLTTIDEVVRLVSANVE